MREVILLKLGRTGDAMHGTVTTAAECREQAAVLLQQAAQTLDPVKRSEFEAWAKKWLVLARKFEHPPPQWPLISCSSDTKARDVLRLYSGYCDSGWATDVRCEVGLRLCPRSCH